MLTIHRMKRIRSMYGRIGSRKSAPTRMRGQTGLGWGQYTQNALPIRSDSGTSQLDRPDVSHPSCGYSGSNRSDCPHARASRLHGLLSPSIR